MANGDLCHRCVRGQRPRAYVVSLAGTCCKCGVSKRESSVCGSCASVAATPCLECGAFNGYFELQAIGEDCAQYVYEFPNGHGPCGATSIELRLTPHADPERVNACVHIHFDQSGGPVRPVSWGKTGVCNCCEIGCLRRRSTNRKCCWPQEITVTPVPVPDFTAPQPEWLAGDPDDLNDAPYWPTMNVDLLEDSDGAPVRLFNGELQVRVKDLGSDGFGIPWGHTRIYSNRLSNSFDFGNGYNSLVHEWPRLVRLKTDPAVLKKISPWEYEPTGCTIVVLRGTRNALWFDQFRTARGTEWLPRFGAKHNVYHDDKKDCTFRLAAPNGQVWYFYDFTCRYGKALEGLPLAERKKRAPGQLKQHVAAGGQTINFEYDECRLRRAWRRFQDSQEVFEYTYIADGTPETCDTPLGEPNSGRLETVTLIRQTRSAGSGPVRRVRFAYYAGESQERAHGNIGDVKMAAVQVPQEGGWKNLRVEYYRYHLEPMNTYCQGMLKYVVGPEACRRLVKEKNGYVDPAPDLDMPPELKWISEATIAQLSALLDQIPDSLASGGSGPSLAKVAALHVLYDADTRRVQRVEVNGASHARSFEYDSTLFPPDYNLPKMITKETYPDSSVLTVESNHVGQPVRVNFAHQQQRHFWRFRTYDERFAALLIDRTPAAVSQAGVGRLGGLVHVFHYSQRREGSLYLDIVGIRNGRQESTRRNLKFYDYEPHGVNGVEIYAVNLETTLGVAHPYAGGTSSGAALTTNSYTAYQNGFSGNHLGWRKTILQGIPPEHNGSGTSIPPSGNAFTVDQYDVHGNLVRSLDLRGAITTAQYHVATGAPMEETISFSFQGQAQTFTTSFKSDSLGRITQALGPRHLATVDPDANLIAVVRKATWYVYKDLSGQVWTAQGHVRGDQATQINPVQIDRFDRAGRVVDSVLAIRKALGRPTPQESIPPQRDWVGWESNHYDDQSRLFASRVYHRIPTTGRGAQGLNYDESKVDYDGMGRPNLFTSPGGIETYAEYDARGLVTSVQVGRTGQRVDVLRNYYDHEGEDPAVLQSLGLNDPGIGNGCLTRSDLYVDGATTRSTVYQYNFRDERISVRLPDGTESGYQYSEQGQLTSVTGTGNLHIENRIDVRGRVYQQIHRGLRLTAVTGVPPELPILVDNIWYNDAGDVLRIHPHGSDAYTRLEYDPLGREVTRLVGTDAFSALKAVSNLTAGLPNRIDSGGQPGSERPYEATITAYNEVGSPVQAINRKRYPNQSAVGPLATTVRARTRVVRMAYDSLARPLATADYGSAGGGVVLAPVVVQIRYDNRGNVARTLDPLGRVTARSYDHARRLVEEAENPFGAALNERRIVRFAYTADGNIEHIIFLPPGKPPQVTSFEYNTSLATSHIASSHLVSAIRYPISQTPTDQDTFTYNRAGEVLRYTDRNGTEHTYERDGLGRVLRDRVTRFGSRVDRSVAQIAYLYHDDGQLAHISSFGPGGQGLNDVVRRFNGRNQIVDEVQAHRAVPSNPWSGYPHVSYSYADGSENHVRPTDITYPAGSRVKFQYDGDGTALGRLTAIKDEELGPFFAQLVAKYDYWGAYELHNVTLPEVVVSPGGALSSGLQFATSDPFSQVDGFDRRSSLIWSPANSGSVVHESLGYGYTPTNVRQFRDDRKSGLKNLGHVYAYDQLDRLRNMSRGRVNAAGGTLFAGTQNLVQDWLLDAADNWGQFGQTPAAPDGTWQWQQQTRQHDLENRLVGIQRQAREVQEVRISSPYPTAGNFRLNYRGQTTANIPYNASASLVQTRLQALSLIGAANVRCWGGPLPAQPVWVEFVGALAAVDVPPLTASNVDLNQGQPSATTVIEGGAKTIAAGYDQHGNMTKLPDVARNRQITCTYDAWNRLVEVRDGAKVLASYSYDGLHRRVMKAATGQHTRHYYYSLAEQVLEERVPGQHGQINDNVVPADRRYVWGLRGLDDLILRDRRVSSQLVLDERLYALQDDNFNVTALAEPMTGQVQERFIYDAYGQFAVLTPAYGPRATSNFDWNIVYGGYRWDPETGLYHVRRRFYHPALGRWLQPDPSAYEDRYNLYQYCLSSPLTYVDGTGEFVHVLGGALFGAGLGALTYALTADEFSWTELMLYTAAGGAAGALAAATFGASLALTAGAGFSATSSALIASTASGAVGGVMHGAITGGGTAALHGGTAGDVLSGAGIGALEQGISGAVGGLVGGYALSRFGAGALGVILSGGAGGAASGSLSGGYQGYIEQGWLGMGEGVVYGAAAGAASGGIMGAGGYYAGRAQARFRTRFAWSRRLGRLIDWGGIQRLPRQRAAHLWDLRSVSGEGSLLVRTNSSAARLPRSQWPVARRRAEALLARAFGRGRFQAHHPKPLSLGGSERRLLPFDEGERNIVWLPARIHSVRATLGGARANYHPNLPRPVNAPYGTLFY